MSVADVDDAPIEVAPDPSSTTSGAFLFRELRRELERVSGVLARRSLKIRGALIAHDSRLDVLELGARAARVTDLPVSAPRGVLLLLAGDDANLYVGLGNAKPLLRIPGAIG